MNAQVFRSSRMEKAGFLHGFSGREGGASEGPFASLNLGASVGDRPEHVAENHQRLAKAIGYDRNTLYEVSQVHGNTVVEVSGAPQTVRTQQADALIARIKTTSVAVRTADCIPLLLADPRTGNVAAVHAGWRGVVSRIAEEALLSLRASKADEVIAAIGPSIGPCCFEVGEDVALQIAQASGDGVVLQRPNARPHVDLWRAVEQQLRRSGVRIIDTLGHCTACEPERFFSWRRDGATSGRMLGVIVAR